MEIHTIYNKTEVFMLEIIATNLEDALLIEKAGADRIELVSAMSEGGLTPSYGMIDAIVSKVSIPVNVMIRPFSHSFEYDSMAIEVMKKDIQVVKKLGANGIVLGMLKDQKVDFEQLNELILDLNMAVTFHRAIDASVDIIADYKRLSDNKFVTQVLTSGGIGRATDNLALIDQLYEINNDQLLIGSGVKRDNIDLLMKRYLNVNLHIGSDVRVAKSFYRGIDLNYLEKIVEVYKHK